MLYRKELSIRKKLFHKKRYKWYQFRKKLKDTNMYLFKNKLFIILKMLIFKLLKVKVEWFLGIRELMSKEMQNLDLSTLHLFIIILIDLKADWKILAMLIRELQECYLLHPPLTNIIKPTSLLKIIPILIRLKLPIKLEEIISHQAMYTAILLFRIWKNQRDRHISGNHHLNL